MNIFFLFQCILLVVITLGNNQKITFPNLKGESLQADIDWLYKKLNSRYWKKDKISNSPYKFQQVKGLYQSFVRVNYVDKKNSKFAELFRNKIFKIQDNNMFVTSFVLYGLIEAQELGTIKVDSHQFSQSVMALSKFKDKNIPDGIPQYNFWLQSLKNGTWFAQPTNLLRTVNAIPNFSPLVQNILDILGLGLIIQAKYIARAFTIPADNDDSGVNLALLGFMKETNSPHYSFWNSLNSKKQQFYERVLKFAYRPFGANKSINPHGDEIDPRTYFAIRHFLDAKKQQNESVILPATWLLCNSEKVQKLLEMPFQVNNVDSSVAANFLFGIMFQVLSQEIKLTDELRQMMINTAQLLVFTVEHIIEERPNLILLYYPSKYDFFWFVARNVQLVKRRCQFSHNAACLSPLPQISVMLEKVMKQKGTQLILKNKHQSGQGYFWREFLGNYANKQRNQDALFSTALAVNALFDTWTLRVGKSIKYDDRTPQQVKQACVKGISYLRSQLGPNMKQFNAFFSGSTKNMWDTFPFFYPSNLNINGKGQLIDPTNSTLYNISTNSTTSVKGYIPAQIYNDMMTKKWYSYNVPDHSSDLNNGTGLLFPFWSAEPITEIMMISCLSKLLRLTENQNESNLSHS